MLATPTRLRERFSEGRAAAPLLPTSTGTSRLNGDHRQAYQVLIRSKRVAKYPHTAFTRRSTEESPGQIITSHAGIILLCIASAELVRHDA